MTAILLLTVEHEGKGEDYIVPIGYPPCGKGKEVACLGGSWVIMVLGTCSPCQVVMVVYLNSWDSTSAEMKTSPSYSNSTPPSISYINHFLNLIKIS